MVVLHDMVVVAMVVVVMVLFVAFSSFLFFAPICFFGIFLSYLLSYFTLWPFVDMSLADLIYFQVAEVFLSSNNRE